MGGAEDWRVDRVVISSSSSRAAAASAWEDAGGDGEICWALGGAGGFTGGGVETQERERERESVRETNGGLSFNYS